MHATATATASADQLYTFVNVVVVVVVVVMVMEVVVVVVHQQPYAAVTMEAAAPYLLASYLLHVGALPASQWHFSLSPCSNSV